MDIDEIKMVKEMAMSIEFACTTDELDLKDRQEIAKTLYILGYRKVGEDEIVVKKDEYMDFLRIRLNELKKHSEFIDGFSQGYKQAKQEIVKKILQELSDEGYKIYEQQGYTFDIGNFYWLIAYAKRKYGINLE